MAYLRIMTYNVQWFTKINSQIDMQHEIIESKKPDIIGIQELTTNGKINAIGRTVLRDYPYKKLSKHKNYLGIASKYPLKNVQSFDFENQDPEDMARFKETRAYQTANIELGGKKILLINTHLCYLTQEIKFKQMAELLDVARKSKYTIITGDFNYFGENEYDAMYRPFVDAGFQLANCNPAETKTWTDKVNPKRLSQFTFPTDNILVYGIQMKWVKFDRTKIKYRDGHPIDHIPIVARLTTARVNSAKKE